jgi:hypothetical protein
MKAVPRETPVVPKSCRRLNPAKAPCSQRRRVARFGPPEMKWQVSAAGVLSTVQRIGKASGGAAIGATYFGACRIAR